MSDAREAMRFALNSLAVLAPEWLLAHSDDTWLDRYGYRFEEAHLPKGQAERQIIAERIGQDGAHLLTDLLAPTAPPWLRQVPAAERLRQIWVQNYLAYQCVVDEKVLRTIELSISLIYFYFHARKAGISSSGRGASLE